MPTTVVEANVESDLKIAAERIISEARLSVSEVLEGVLKKIVAEGYVSIDLFHPNAETLASGPGWSACCRVGGAR